MAKKPEEKKKTMGMKKIEKMVSKAGATPATKTANTATLYRTRLKPNTEQKGSAEGKARTSGTGKMMMKTGTVQKSKIGRPNPRYNTPEAQAARRKKLEY